MCKKEETSSARGVGKLRGNHKDRDGRFERKCTEHGQKAKRGAKKSKKEVLADKNKNNKRRRGTLRRILHV